MRLRMQTWKFLVSACLAVGCGGALCGESLGDPSAGPSADTSPRSGAASLDPAAAAAPGVARAELEAAGELPVVVFAADFFDETSGFTFVADPDAPSNLWHRTANRFASPTNCLYYGMEDVWNYDTVGSRNAGNLQSPAISLAGALAPITLSFNHLLQTEGIAQYDHATVLISADDGATWAALISTTNLVNPLVQSASFTNVAVDLSAYAGRDIVLRFNFDTVDSSYNGFEGWYLDDVVIRAAAVQRIVTVNAVDTGWYNDTGFHDPLNANYFCGQDPRFDAFDYRDWFVFDVPALTGVVASAELLINCYDTSSPSGFETYELRQVATPIAQLVAGGNSLTNIYDDLADGALYGRRNVYTSETFITISVPLNAAFRSTLTAASGGQIALGGSISTMDGIVNDEYIFGYSRNNPGDVQLRFTLATNLPTRVALFCGETEAAWNADVKAKLVATGRFADADVDVYAGGFATPTLSQLQQYDAVLTWSNQAYSDGTAFGNVLADYVDNGGGVVVATFAFSDVPGNVIGGRFGSGDYLPFTIGAFDTPGDLTLVKDLPLHPLLSGVTSFNGGQSSYHNSLITITPNATLVAHWSNGQPLVGARETAAGRIAGLNFFPPSSDAREDFWAAGTDGGRLMANALLWAAKQSTRQAGVAVFDNPLYVDSASDTDGLSESDNVQASLTDMGYPVDTFTDIISGIAGHSVVLIPELERGDLAADLTAPERDALLSFVQGGGTLVVHGSHTTIRTADLINAVLGTSLTEATEDVGSVYNRTPQAAGTSFASCPATLAALNGSDYLATASLPPGALSIYSSGTRTLVAVLPSGAGRIVFLGWDWFDAMPIGFQDGGWLQALSSAVSFWGTTLIDTTSAWNGSDSISAFGEPDTATYGQTFVAPPQAILNRFTVYLNNIVASVDFKFYIMAWDGTKATGPILYQSAAASTAGQTGMQPFTFYTGDLVLTPGATYVAFACASTLFDGVEGLARMGLVGDTYAGGSFMYNNNGADFSLLTSSSWYSWDGDLAFVAAFAGGAGGGGGVASLRFLPLQLSGSNLQLLLGTADRSPIAPERAGQIQFYATTNLFMPFSSWLQLTQPTVLIDGVLWVEGLSTTDPVQRFFRAVETP